jgi:hypothetical protein
VAGLPRGGISVLVRGEEVVGRLAVGGRGQVVVRAFAGRRRGGAATAGSAGSAFGVRETVEGGGTLGALPGQDVLQLLFDQFIAVGLGVFDALLESGEVFLGLGEALS